MKSFSLNYVCFLFCVLRLNLFIFLFLRQYFYLRRIPFYIIKVKANNNIYKYSAVAYVKILFFFKFQNVFYCNRGVDPLYKKRRRSKDKAKIRLSARRRLLNFKILYFKAIELSRFFNALYCRILNFINGTAD